MTLLLEFKEKLKQVYARYGTALLPVLKFILAMAVFKCINVTMPYVEALDSVFVLLILSLICSIMPLNIMVIFGIFLIVAQCYGIGLEVAGFALALILVMVILYGRFTPQDALILILTPAAFALKVPCVIPLGCGLTRSPASAISAGFGVIIYYFIELVNQKYAVLQGADKKEIAQNLKLLLDGLLNNQNMMICIIAFAVVVIVVNLIRRLSVDYAWQMAIFSGAIAYVVVMAAGGLFLDVKVPVVPLIAGTIGAVVLAYILEFFLFHVDYSRTEMIQFEDDEYYYYVKAVPKMSISNKDVTVKTIQSGIPEEPPVRVRPGPVPQETITFAGVHPGREGFAQEREEDIKIYPGREENRDNSRMSQEDIPEGNVDYESKLEQSLRDL